MNGAYLPQRHFHTCQRSYLFKLPPTHRIRQTPPFILTPALWKGGRGLHRTRGSWVTIWTQWQFFIPRLFIVTGIRLPVIPFLAVCVCCVCVFTEVGVSMSLCVCLCVSMSLCVSVVCLSVLLYVSVSLCMSVPLCVHFQKKKGFSPPVLW